MGLKIDALLWLVSFAIWEDTVLDHHIWTVLEKMIFTLAKCMSHVAQMALNLHVHKLIQNNSLDFHCLKRIVWAAPIGTEHVGLHMLLAHHVLARLVCADHWVSQYFKAEAASEGISDQLLLIVDDLVDWDIHIAHLDGQFTIQAIFALSDTFNKFIGRLKRFFKLLLPVDEIHLFDVGGTRCLRLFPWQVVWAAVVVWYCKIHPTTGCGFDHDFFSFWFYSDGLKPAIQQLILIMINSRFIALKFIF